MRKLLVTGASGLIGSEVVAAFSRRGWRVVGVDNNMRADFFGPQGDTRWNAARLQQELPGYELFDVDIRDRDKLIQLVANHRPDAIVHAAAQPSHDLAATRPFDDFDINAVGTLNMLEAARRACPEAPFVHMSTNKVYGDAPNNIQLRELPTRWDYDDPAYADGIAETFSIDQSKHSLFGASKVAADVMVQEYGRYFGMPTCCLRGGCLTGPNHSGVELHGFLSYLVKCSLEGRTYRVFGYKGKQVRDNIHSHDVVEFIARVHRPAPCRRGLQHRRRPPEFLLDSRSVRSGRPRQRKENAARVRRPKPHRRPHLLHLEPRQNAGPLPLVADYQEPGRHLQRNRPVVARAEPRMKLLVVTNLFHPDRGGGASVFSDMCSSLAARGHDVTVYAAYPYYPEWKNKSNARLLRVANEDFNGVKVKRFGLYIPANPSRFVPRIMYEVSFTLSLLRSLAYFRRFDAVMVYCPLMGAVLYSAVRKVFYREPTWLNVQDFPADAAAAAGISNNPLVRRLSQRVQTFLFNRARVWSTIAPQMIDRLAAMRRRDQPIHFVPNFLNGSMAETIAAHPPKVGRPPHEPIRLLYAGNIGKKQNLLEFCQQLAATPAPFEFQIHGNGGEAERVRQWVAASGDARFRFGDFLDEQGFVAALFHADLFVITETPGVGASFIPSKLIPCMATSTPVLALCDVAGPLGQEVRQHGLGLALPWDEIPALAAHFNRFAADASEFTRLQQACVARSRAYAREPVVDAVERELAGMLRVIARQPPKRGPRPAPSPFIDTHVYRAARRQVRRSRARLPSPRFPPWPSAKSRGRRDPRAGLRHPRPHRPPRRRPRRPPPPLNEPAPPPLRIPASAFGRARFSGWALPRRATSSLSPRDGLTSIAPTGYVNRPAAASPSLALQRPLT